MRKLGLLILIMVMSVAVVNAQVPPNNDELTIRVWWSDGLYDENNEDAIELLDELVTAFNRSNPDYNVEVRIKLADGEGSLISTLIAARPVAPSVVPDLVLLDRGDLVQAVRGGAVQQIDDWTPDELRTTLLEQVLRLGEVDSLLYGVPYAIQLQHGIYRTEDFETAPLTFQDILDAESRFWIPNMPTGENATSDILILQYLSAGGRLVDNDGLATLDQEPLLDVLAFYEEALAEGVITLESINFGVPQTYWNRFLNENVPLTIIDSTTFIQSSEDDMQDFTIIPVPTISERSVTALNGWVWALTTSNDSARDGALAFLEWIMGTENQANYTETFGVLPTNQRAIRLWDNTTYTEQLEAWVSAARIIPLEQRNNAAGVALQAAYQAVLDGATHEDAAENAINSLSSTSN